MPAPADPPADLTVDPPVDLAVDAAWRDRLVAGAVAEAEAVLAAVPGGAVPAALPHRATMRSVLVLAVADLVGPADARRAAAATALVDHLERLQGPTGLFDGDNLVSPPDSSFTLNDVAATLEVLGAHGSPGPGGVAPRLRAVALRSLESLLVGGVHTPNHRWELCAALAGLHRLTGDPRLVDRVDEWLAEGVDVDADGFYSERSPNYAAYVSHPALLTVARLLDRPALRAPVLASLRTLVALSDDDGEVVSVHSRRQDQRETFALHGFAGQLRWAAATTGDGQLARLARVAGSSPRVEHARELVDALLDPVRLAVLPPGLPAVDGTVHLPTVGLVRHRAGATTTTVFGGSDHPRTGRIASGLANSATLVQVRHGAARLRALRVSPAFFDTGAFRPDALALHGRTVTLTGERVSGYYQPLAPADRDPGGRYALTDEGRFFAEMSFGDRPRSELRLATTVQVGLHEHRVEVDVACRGVRTRLGLELVLGDGDVDGIEPHPDVPDAWVLRGDALTVRAGADVLRVRVRGHDGSVPPTFEDGEVFGYVHGHDRVPGTRVLVGGWTDRPLHVDVEAVP